MKKIPAFFIFCFLLITSSTSFAQNSTEVKWQKVDAGTGDIAEIAISPTNPDIIYTGMENNAHTLYKSIDGGITWQKIAGPGEHTRDVAVSPKNPNKAYVGMSHTIHSTDLSFKSAVRDPYFRPGVKTQPILDSEEFGGPAATSFSSVEIFNGDDEVIYAAVRGGGSGPGFSVKPKIYKTVDGGRTWKKLLPILKRINVIEIHPIDHNLIYIGADDGVYVSRNSGETTTKLKGTNRNVVSIDLQIDNLNIIYFSAENEVFKSTDSGKSWMNITGPLKDIHRVRVARSNPNILYAATFNGIFKSTDGGKSWVDKTSNLKTKNFQVISIHPQNSDIAFIGTSSLWSATRGEDRYRQGLLAHQGIYKTTDGGNIWLKSDQGIIEYNFEEVATNQAKTYEAWFAGVASLGAMKTEDGGINFRQTQLATLHYPMRIKFSWQNPKRVYATSWHNGGPFATSSDGGINWDILEEEPFFNAVNRGKNLYTPSQGGGVALHLHGLAVDPKDDKIIYVGSTHDVGGHATFPLEGSHIFKSTDGGRSWKESDEGFPHQKHTSVHDLTVDPKNTKIIYAATTKHEAKIGIGVYKSEAGGENWKAVNNGIDNLNTYTLIVHPKKEIIIVAGDGGLYRSEDGGISWKKTNSSSSFDAEYVEDNPDIVYASTDQGVLESRDFGQTWHNFGSDLPFGEGQGIGVDKTGQVIYAAIRNHGLFVARMKDIEPKDLPTELGKGRGFIPGHGGGMYPFSTNGISFFTILFSVIGVFATIALLIFAIIYWKNRNRVIKNG